MNDETVEVINSRNRYFDFTKLNRYENILFVGGLLVSVMLISIRVISFFNDSHLEEENIISSCIIIVTSLFSFVYLFRGIFEERPYELLVYVISAICLMFYIVIDFTQNFAHILKTSDVLSYVNIAVALVILPMTIALGTLNAYNYNVRGNLIFRTIEGSERLQDDCKNAFVFEALLQLDIQFEFCMIVLVLAASVTFRMFQKIILSIGFPFSFFWHIGGFISMREELTLGTIIFLFLGLLEPVYIIYIIYNAINNIMNAIVEPIMEPVLPVVSTTFAICFLSLIIRILLLLICCGVYRKFGNGLKDRLKYCCCSTYTPEDTVHLLNSPQSLS